MAKIEKIQGNNLAKIEKIQGKKQKGMLLPPLSFLYQPPLSFLYQPPLAPPFFKEGELGLGGYAARLSVVASSRSTVRRRVICFSLRWCLRAKSEVVYPLASIW